MGTRLAGMRALVTAAGQGIGRASALAMAAEGAHVFATDINEEALREVTALANGDIRMLLLNVRDEDNVQSAVAQAQPDILQYCAGFVHHGTAVDTTDEDWDFSFDLNVKAMFRMIRSSLPGMLERGGGSIINMSSAASSIIGAPNRFVYGASKAAVIGMTKSVAVDYIKQGVRCNAICPGTVESPSWHERVKAAGEASGDVDAARAAFVARQPMGRVGKAEEIAALVVYLGSDESAFTTGQPFVIDGGWSG